MLDPTAPIPAGWPTGAWGAFLLFAFPVGGGIPTGVLRARDDGVALWLLPLLFIASDVVAAFLNEPIILFASWLGRQIPVLGQLGRGFVRLTQRTGLQDDGPRGPLGLVLVSFTMSLMTGRAAAKAAGHGFLSGWSLAITGDTLYFLLLMGSTLFLSSIFDERVTVGIVLVAMFFLPSLLKRFNTRKRPPPPARVATMVRSAPGLGAAVPAAAPVRVESAPRRPKNRRKNRRR